MEIKVRWQARGISVIVRIARKVFNVPSRVVPPAPNVTVMNMGHVGSKGAKFKFRFSDPVHFALIGGDFQAAPLRN